MSAGGGAGLAQHTPCSPGRPQVRRHLSHPLRLHELPSKMVPGALWLPLLHALVLLCSILQLFTLGGASQLPCLVKRILPAAWQL